MSAFDAWLDSPFNTEELSSIICLALVSSLLLLFFLMEFLSLASPVCCLSRGLFVFPLLVSSFYFYSDCALPILNFPTC